MLYHVSKKFASAQLAVYFLEFDFCKSKKQNKNWLNIKFHVKVFNIAKEKQKLYPPPLAKGLFQPASIRGRALSDRSLVQ